MRKLRQRKVKLFTQCHIAGGLTELRFEPKLSNTRAKALHYMYCIMCTHNSNCLDTSLHRILENVLTLYLWAFNMFSTTDTVMLIKHL